MPLNSDQLQELLHYIENGKIANLEALFAKAKADGNPIDVNAPVDGEFLLIRALRAEGGNSVDTPKIIELLLKEGASGDAKSESLQQSAFDIALENNDEKSYQAMIRYNLAPESFARGLKFAITVGDDYLIGHLIKDKPNLDIIYPNDLTPLFLAVFHERKNICQALLDAGANINFRSKSGSSALDYAIDLGKEDMAIFLAKSIGIDLSSKDDEGLTCTMNAAVRTDMDNFLRIITSEDLSLLKEVTRARVLLGLSYSQNHQGGHTSYNIKAIKEILSKDGFSLPQKDKFVVALNSMQDRSISSNKLQAVYLPYQGHAAFCVVEYDEQGAAQYLSYCDGILPISKINSDGHGYGEVRFKVRPEIAANTPDFAQELIDVFTADSEFIAIGSHFAGDRLKPTLAKLVECDEAGQPIVERLSIPTKPQNRGNCTIKSINIVLRVFLAHEPDLDLVFEEVRDGTPTGNPGGSGYELFKQYKNLVLQDCLKTMFDLLAIEEAADRKKEVYAIILDAAQIVFLQAAKKNDVALMEKIQKILVKEKIDPNKLVNTEQGENALTIAAKNGSVEAFAWCLENGVGIEADKLGYSVLKSLTSTDDKDPAKNAKKDQMLALLLKHNPKIDVESKEVKALVSSAAKRKRTDIVGFFLEKGFDPNFKIDGKNSLLSWSATQKNFDLIKLLLQNDDFKIDPADRGFGAALNLMVLEISKLETAKDSEKEDAGKKIEELKELMNLALQKVENITENSPAMMALSQAVSRGSKVAAEILLQNNVNCKGDKYIVELNPLNIAVEKGDEKMVQLLIANKATIRWYSQEEADKMGREPGAVKLEDLNAPIAESIAKLHLPPTLKNDPSLSPHPVAAITLKGHEIGISVA
jgi:ankyrin repeat protein